VVLALGDLHAVDGEEDVLLAADRGNSLLVSFITMILITLLS
jgi:Tfp pilus assembly protein PilX